MVHLPYMEDVRQYSFPSLPGPSRNAEPSGIEPVSYLCCVLSSLSLSLSLSSADQLTAVDNLISTMDLMKADKYR